ncbi:hypothetical protein BDF14DRAFT_1717406 [Spinellus fusiger]|nr:hypothetical protein BDF14DRAFT_1717406 [Spinellus fusiger]
MTAGLIFIWTHKQIQPQVVRLMASLNCKYVENLIWFKKSINNVPIDQPSPYISSTKEILLIFKKVSANREGFGEGFELRHQRSADVVIDFELPRQHWIEQDYTEPKPTAVYEMIETLLPKAGYQETLGRGRLLELWAKKTSPRRKGWISICQNKPTSHGIKTTPTGIELAIREELNSMTIEEKMED